MRRAQGFTLIEVLVALMVFALIAALADAATGAAGEGFRRLSRVRDRHEAMLLTGMQLRSDTAYATTSYDARWPPLQLQSDERGGRDFDQLTLLVREPGKSSLTLVHYAIDEARGELVRTSRMAWARDGTPGQRWAMGSAEALSIEAMDAHGDWRQRWPPGGAFRWPRALRIRIRRSDGMHEWLLPIALAEGS